MDATQQNSINIMKNFNETMKEQAEAALDKQKNATKDFILKLIPSALWTAATIWGGIALALNTKGSGLYVVLGVIASAGALITTFKVYRNYHDTYEK